MLDHVGLAVRDLARSRMFYTAALAPLGLVERACLSGRETESGGTAILFGPAEGEAVFVIADGERPGEGNHVAFRAADRAAVDAFHAAAIAAGGRDHGAPGLRPHYGVDYYAAFVIDPDGFNVEAVCHAPVAPPCVEP